MNFAIKTFNELTIDELYEIVKSRFEVFVCEQKIVEDQEFDDKDKVSYHIMLKENDKVVAYCRIVPKEIGYDYTSIGRVLVLSSYRRKGIAQEMIKVALDFIKNNLNENIVVFDADLSTATKTSLFAKEFPDRFFDMGIAEQNMISTAAGMATCGKIPYASTFAVFAAGRAYDQIRNSVCYPKLNVKICATHAGITVGEDGATHQMIEDISLMRTLPNMTVISTSDDVQTKWAVKEISKINGPVYLRLSRLATPIIYDENQKFEIEKAVQIGEGTDATIFATGVTVSEAIMAQRILKEKGINVRVIDVHTIKPIDKEMIVKCAKETKKLISIEDHNIIGGLGSAISEVLTDECPTKLIRIGIKDTFGKSGKAIELMKYFGITAEDLVKILEQ